MMLRKTIGVLSIGLLLMSCQNNNENQQSIQEADSHYQGLSGDEDQAHVKDPQVVAEHLTSLALEINEVNDATAVVGGRYAVVGLDLNDKIDQEEVGMIKYQVAEAFQDDPYGAHAAITADTDLYTRLTEMNAEMNNGRPLAGIMDELAEIVGRLIPIMPTEEHHQQTPNPTNSNDEKLNRGEEQQLHHIQKEQLETSNE